MSTLNNSSERWRQSFLRLPAGLKVQMLKSLQPHINKRVVMNCILSLPFAERNSVIPQIPNATLIELIKILPVDERKLLLNALTSPQPPPPPQSQSQTQSQPPPIPKSTAPQPQSQPKNSRMSRNNIRANMDAKIHQILQRSNQTQTANGSAANNGNFYQSSHNSVSRKSAIKRLTSRQRKSLASSMPGKPMKNCDLETVDPISDVDESFDMDSEARQSGFTLSQLKSEPYVKTIRKMMRAFGDAAVPSRYCAFLISHHIESYLKNTLEYIRESAIRTELNRLQQLASATAIAKAGGNGGSNCEVPSPKASKRRSKGNSYHISAPKEAAIRRKYTFKLGDFEAVYPKQLCVFQQIKRMHDKTKAKTATCTSEEQVGVPSNPAQAPDHDHDHNTTTAEDDHESQTDNDNSTVKSADSTSLSSTNKDKPFFQSLENLSDPSSFYEIKLETPSVSVGWGVRLVECDRFTKVMDKRTYFKFAKCREACFVRSTPKFLRWLAIPQSRMPKSPMPHFVGFLAWDRVGCIIQIARGIRGVGNQIIKDDYLKASEIRKAIEIVNSIPEITPVLDRTILESLSQPTQAQKVVPCDSSTPMEQIKSESQPSSISNGSNHAHNHKSRKRKRGDVVDIQIDGNAGAQIQNLPPSQRIKSDQ